MSTGIKIDIQIEDGEYVRAVLYPDLTVEFQDYDIEHDIVLAEMGEEPTDAVRFLINYEKHGILTIALDEDGDLYESFLDNADSINGMRKKEKVLWANQICGNLEPILEKTLYDEEEIRIIHHIIDLLSENLTIDGAEHYIDSVEGFYLNINGTLVVNINGKKCLDAEVVFVSGYGDSSPDDPEFITNDLDYDDDLGNNIKNLYHATYGTKYKSSREFDINEPHKSDMRFNEYFNPLKGFDSGKWALVIRYAFGGPIEFSAIYKTEYQLNSSLDYIYEWFENINCYEVNKYRASPYKDNDEIPSYEQDEFGDPSGIVLGGWEEI